MDDPKGARKYTTDEVSDLVHRALVRKQEAAHAGHTEGVRISHDELIETVREIGISADDIEAVVAEEEKLRAARAEVETRLRGEQAAALARRRKEGRVFLVNLGTFVVVNGALLAIDKLFTGGTWFFVPLAVWGVVLALHAVRLVFPKAEEEASAASAPFGSAAKGEPTAVDAAHSDRKARLDAAFRNTPPRPLAGRRSESAEDAKKRAQTTQRTRR